MIHDDDKITELKSHDFHSAEGLLEYLMPHKAHWGTEPRDWLFRGQEDSTWDLQPSAFREARIKPFKAKPNPNGSACSQVSAEARVLEFFYRMGDVQALPIPNGGVELLSTLAEYVKGAKDDDWIPQELRPLGALAQHHLLPTRLLDWTRKPLIATYFAAYNVADPTKVDQAGERIAVWALRKERLIAADQRGGLVEVRALRAQNPNLHLQSGLFTMYVPESIGNTHDLPHNKVVELLDAQRTTPPGALPPPSLIKLTLPKTKREELMKLLAKHFVSGTTVYSGYEGAARGTLERAFRGR
jgi:hypothetical protein